MISSLFKKFLGSGTTPPVAEAIDHKGFAITPDPIRESSGWRVAARIEKDGKVHHMTRADTMGDRDQCAEISLAKARQMIDEQGDGIF